MLMEEGEENQYNADNHCNDCINRYMPCDVGACCSVIGFSTFFTSYLMDETRPKKLTPPGIIIKKDVGTATARTGFHLIKHGSMNPLEKSMERQE